MKNACYIVTYLYSKVNALIVLPTRFLPAFLTCQVHIAHFSSELPNRFVSRLVHRVDSIRSSSPPLRFANQKYLSTSWATSRNFSLIFVSFTYINTSNKFSASLHKFNHIDNIPRFALKIHFGCYRICSYHVPSFKKSKIKFKKT